MKNYITSTCKITKKQTYLRIKCKWHEEQTRKTNLSYRYAVKRNFHFAEMYYVMQADLENFVHWMLVRPWCYDCLLVLCKY